MSAFFFTRGLKRIRLIHKGLNMSNSVFYFDSVSFDAQTGEIHFTYHVKNGPEFVEKVVFPGAPFVVDETIKRVLDQVLFLAHIAVGISYYKAFLPDEIQVLSGTLTRDQAAFFDAFYLKGLGEFAIRNNLNLQGKIHFPFGDNVPEKIVLPLEAKALVPVGGGKDSCVVMELLKELKVPATGVACGGSKSQSACAEKSGLPYFTFKRIIDPKLMELNESGKVYNGHIPITGVFAFLLWALALLRGEKYVVMACEKSANSGNMQQGDLTINHQWSKSFEFEKMFYDLTQSITPNFRYFSLLRPISEAHIAKLFAQKCAAYFDVFTALVAHALPPGHALELARGVVRSAVDLSGYDKTDTGADADDVRSGSELLVIVGNHRDGVAPCTV